ncbi:LacI family DNA-binding transcriptional regulator [Protaetiibacter intestinalis]|uniref:LacI family DNA-binding transcriptional regulator n=1 Tax=Protaetiibacter intestinalis TaxID=2419774 RepID=A0A387B1F4_9MICO|nr:LacI family DNA-binding transcriptional regulator [Protaetiibacter intestinalis]AYF97352.1 LacI family DNA-binding transcriptional regulator [Protaetiibacter intestinalis]
MTLDPAASGRPPSIRDVARVAGVSHQTVSRVLNNHPSIRDTTRQRVLEVMAELQYQPNRAARALASSRSRTIGILSAMSTDYGPASIMTSVEAAARANGYWVSVANIDPSVEGSISDALAQLRAQAVEGIVVVAPQVRVFEALATLPLDIPYVTLQSTSDDGHALFFDQYAGARLATRHLLELGHRGIYHLSGPQDWIEADARMQGFLDELNAWDAPTTAPILGDWSADFGYFAGRELLRVRDFTAVFASNDQMALGLLHALRDGGVDVPGEVSVIGFDDIPEAAHFWPPLTTVRQDFPELGRRAVAFLLGELDAEGAHTIAPQLMVRNSTAPVAR